MAAPRLLLPLLLGLGATRPSVPGRSLRAPAVGLNSPLEVHEGTQIPSNGSAPLLLAVQVFVTNVFNVDILRYTVSSMLLLRLSWLDTRLARNASVHPRHVRTLPWDSLWTPGLTIQEALWVDWQDPSPRAQVDQDGHVELYLTLTTETNCDFELLHFPRDQSNCTLSFYAFSNSARKAIAYSRAKLQRLGHRQLRLPRPRSWRHPESETGGSRSPQLTALPSLPPPATELEFRPHVVNEIVSVKREYVVRDLKSQVPPRQLVPCFRVSLHLQNTALKAILALLVPGEALLLADLCGGLLPLQAAERTAFKVTLLLGYLVFHSSLVQALPSSSSCNPLLIHYFTVQLLLLFASTMETVLLAALLARDHRRAKRSPGPAPRGEQRAPEDAGPSPEGRGLLPASGLLLGGVGRAPECSPCPCRPTGAAGGAGSWRSRAEAADHAFFLLYVAGVVCSQLVFIGLWTWATCKSDPAPGEAVPHGGQPRLYQGRATSSLSLGAPGPP
ncbi:zinc-activated ligand-gated ion channel [Pipistrellus kuhlii]|uniref:zinc-activated ligand-gated ion channel n=1 Tax=Pipistrellus kuhlii TaxID=59472 RepID=UPI001E27045E|nr:zinc-activated ligand-gated ion channel [Pipistrellus kuhlii]